MSESLRLFASSQSHLPVDSSFSLILLLLCFYWFYHHVALFLLYSLCVFILTITSRPPSSTVLCAQHQQPILYVSCSCHFFIPVITIMLLSLLPPPVCYCSILMLFHLAHSPKSWLFCDAFLSAAPLSHTLFWLCITSYHVFLMPLLSPVFQIQRYQPPI